MNRLVCPSSNYNNYSVSTKDQSVSTKDQNVSTKDNSVIDQTQVIKSNNQGRTNLNLCFDNDSKDTTIVDEIKHNVCLSSVMNISQSNQQSFNNYINYSGNIDDLDRIIIQNLSLSNTTEDSEIQYDSIAKILFINKNITNFNMVHEYEKEIQKFYQDNTQATYKLPPIKDSILLVNRAFSEQYPELYNKILMKFCCTIRTGDIRLSNAIRFHEALIFTIPNIGYLCGEDLSGIFYEIFKNPDIQYELIIFL